MTFIDTNVLIYHLGQPDHDFGPRSSALLGRLRAGTEVGYISSTVVAECIHVFRTRYNIPNAVVADALLEILTFAGLRSDHPSALADALRFWRDQGPLSFPDCFHLALAKQLGMTRIYSFDRKMNRYPGVERIEP
ncbi:MAG: PIN domain-containing protein [Chloroflexia bacterium]|nr:PIN domain-containing protein [Chloroflexia bacterium]